MNEIQKRILLVEDDEALRFIVKDHLEQNNYLVDIADDGLKAIDSYNTGNYALIILDVMLPEKDGFEVAKTIRLNDTNTPIIFLTARSMTEDKIHGLTLGGDDYITKPFSMEELLLKIKVFLKRSVMIQDTELNSHSDQIKIGKYLFLPDDLLLKYGDQNKKLTQKESELIHLFVKNRNRILNRDDILNKIWGSNDYFLGRSLDVFISRLRKYFKEDETIKITNIHGIGFKFIINSTN